MSDGDWSLGTFEGVRRDQARRTATSTLAQRLAWLEEMLRLALASGALLRERELKQQAIDRAWQVDVPDPSWQPKGPNP